MVRINEVEYNIDKDLSSKRTETKSSDAKDQKDIYQYTIRLGTQVITSSETYADYPFDSHLCRWSCELSHFKKNHDGS